MPDDRREVGVCGRLEESVECVLAVVESGMRKYGVVGVSKLGSEMENDRAWGVCRRTAVPVKGVNEALLPELGPKGMIPVLDVSTTGGGPCDMRLDSLDTDWRRITARLREWFNCTELPTLGREHVPAFFDF